MTKTGTKGKAYWYATLKLLGIILVVWAGVSLFLSIIFVDALNKVSLGGYPLGFWFAQQGSIYVFIILIVVYIFFMGRIDNKYDVHEDKKKGKE